MWLSLCILSWCCFSHSVRQIFWSRYGWKPWEQAGDWDKWAGTIALAWSARCSWASLQYANCPVYSLLVTVGLGDRITFTIAAVLPSHTQAFPHIHPHTHAQPGSSQWAIVPWWSFFFSPFFFKWPVLFAHLVCLSLRDRISLPRSLPLAVWPPSWGRVTCSLLAWQSASPSPPAASTCWPPTANRLG